MAENRELALVLKLVADQFQSELKKSGGLLGEFNKFVSDWKVQLSAAGGALFAIAKSTANYGEELLKTSQKVGINIQALAGLQYAANLSDLSTEQLSAGLKFLSQNMVEAATQTGNGEMLFARLGISAKDAAGNLKPTEQVLMDLADVFANAADGAGKTEASVKLFGKAGIELIPFLNQGKAGIAALMDEAQRLGIVLSKEDAEAANRFNDEMKKLEAGLQGLKLQIGKELIPTFTQLLSAMKDVASGPMAALFKAEFQGLASIFTLLSHGIRETSAEITTFYNKLGKSDAVKKFYDEALAQGLKRLDEGTNKKLRTIFDLPGGNEKTENESFGPPAPKKTIPSGFNPILAEQLAAQNAIRQKAIQANLEMLNAGFDRERLIIETGLAAGTTLEVEAATERATVRRQELEAAASALQAQKTAELAFYADRVKLGFKDAADRLKVETDYQQKLAELNQKIALNRAQLTTAQLQGQKDIDQATATSSKKQLDLLFAGVAALDQTRAVEQQQQIDLAQAWVTYYDQLGGNTDAYYSRKMDLLRAQLAKELDLNARQAANLLMAWQNYDAERAEEILTHSPMTALQKETIQLKTMQQSILNKNEAGGDFFAGWAEGMRRYVKDTQTGFGLAADMARRTAQTMEQGFKNFFFDAMSGKIRSFKDALASLLDFTKQIVSQMASQLIVRNLLTAGTNIGASLELGMHGPVGSATQAAMGGQIVRRFAMGGPVPGFGNQDTVPALLTPGEVVLSRRDVSDIKGGLGGGISVVVNNYAKAEVQTSTGQGPDGKQMLYLTVRDMVRGMVRSGEIDAANRARYGYSPKPIGR